jgi:hypothetical protein
MQYRLLYSTWLGGRGRSLSYVTGILVCVAQVYAGKTHGAHAPVDADRC